MHPRWLPVGTQVVAVEDFGPIVRGQVGIVTAVVRASRLFWRRRYICRFLGDMWAVASPDYIARFDHGLTIDLLGDRLWFLRGSCWRQAYGAAATWRVLRFVEPP